MLLFLFSLMFKDFITEFSQLYIPDAALNSYEVMLMLLAGFLINAGVVTGLIFMLAKRNIGPFLYTFSATLILIYQFFMGNYLLTDKFVVEIFLLMLILVLRIWFSKAKHKSDISIVDEVKFPDALKS
jgi:hypothetical protein